MPTLKSYVREAVEVGKAGLTVPKPRTQQAVPEEFQQQIDRRPELKKAFAALTPGRQRRVSASFRFGQAITDSRRPHGEIDPRGISPARASTTNKIARGGSSARPAKEQDISIRVGHLKPAQAIVRVGQRYAEVHTALGPFVN